MPSILFLDILTGDKNLRKAIERNVYGGETYSETMRKAFGLGKNQWLAIDASKGKFPSKLEKFDGVVMGGSTEDPVKGHEKAWMKKVYKFIKSVVSAKVPILGICGGLQFTVRALGGEIIYNSKGREFGSTKIKLNSLGQRDLLFMGVPKNSIFQESHKCMAKKLLPGWRLLANSKICPNQAIAIGDKIRLSQFHLELTKKNIQSIARMRKDALLEEGFVKNEAGFRLFLSSVKNANNVSRKVLKNFVKYFVLTAQRQKAKL